MSEEKYDKFVVLEVPIYSIDYLKGFLLVVGAGGGKKFGVRNFLLSMKIKNNKICQEPVHKVEYENDFPIFVKTINKNNTCLVCLGGNVVVYSIDINNGSIKEINNIKIQGSSSEDIFLTTLSFNENLSQIAFGNSVGMISLWNVNTYSNDKIEITKYKEVNDKHVDKINDLLFMTNKKILISASLDSTCKLLDINTLAIVKILTFRSKLDEKNYIFRSLELYNGDLITLQSPMRGESYITKWNTSNFEAIKTKKVCTNTCIVMKRIGGNMILGESSGDVLNVDCENLDVVSNKNIHGLATKSICSINNKFYFTSSPDQMITINKVQEKRFISLFGILKIILLSIIIYYLVQRNELLKTTNIHSNIDSLSEE